ncbi:nuclear transport factor 2 family protein [Shewanella gelidimarina]|uniref:YybH family protein n=1 Tax=Shewanella gelidimarina TaxID=56813 RepID=UPI00200C5B58|nr:nuclear transport factor 2 family protein [Shewanella gelidimarina]MCL1059201.1 nuclear transport factor 2 family protein [Shewanella gelidimarina]
MFKKAANRLALTVCLYLAAMHLAFANDNEALNELYTHFNEAFNELDISRIQSIYSEDACYIPESQGEEITLGRDNIVALYKTFFGKIKHKNAKIEVDFRVIERNLEGTSATDIGYYLIRFHPSIDAGEPVSEFAGKFVTVSQKKENGKWYLTVDTNNRAEASFYFNAKPTSNLYYGRQFSALNSNVKPKTHDEPEH